METSIVSHFPKIFQFFSQGFPFLSHGCPFFFVPFPLSAFDRPPKRPDSSELSEEPHLRQGKNVRWGGPWPSGIPIEWMVLFVVYWLVVWNIFYFPIYWVANHPNWLSYFSKGWPNHQPVYIAKWMIWDDFWCSCFFVVKFLEVSSKMMYPGTIMHF